MTERIQTAVELKQIMDLPGWRHIQRIFNQVSEEAWHDFLALPVDKKTSKASYNAQALYKAPGKILEAIADEVRAGEADMKREAAKRG